MVAGGIDVPSTPDVRTECQTPAVTDFYQHSDLDLVAILMRFALGDNMRHPYAIIQDLDSMQNNIVAYLTPNPQLRSIILNL